MTSSAEEALLDIRDQLVGKDNANLNTVQISVDSAKPTIIAYANSDRRSIMIRNIGGSDIYLGNANVTTSIGFPLRVDDAIVLDKTKGEIWAIALTVGATISYIEE